jgi:hypothetical protein
MSDCAIQKSRFETLKLRWLLRPPSTADVLPPMEGSPGLQRPIGSSHCVRDDRLSRPRVARYLR